MIKLLDRVTNQQILLKGLPEHIVPGRYLLCEDVLLNQHTMLKSGTILSGDGSDNLKINDLEFKCSGQLDAEFQAACKFIGLALHQIAEAFSSGDLDELPSPLLPSNLFSEEGELNALEEMLDEVLARGHLQEISRRPRYDMRYDELVQPISRSKRLASSSHRHLSAHSECWQARTLTGIQPKKVLSRVSEDEYNLYENRAFARLVDRLERFLDKRLKEVSELQKNLNDALDLEDSSDIDFRLSKKLFELWGETFTSEAALLALDALEETQKKLTAFLKKVRSLIQGDLYRRIPRNAQISGRLQPTNILTHDQHYRHLLMLWNTLQVESKKDHLTPAETTEINQRLQQHYGEYCQLITIRALKELHFSVGRISSVEYQCSRFGRTVKLQINKSKDLELTDSINKTSIVLVPIFSWAEEHPGVVRDRKSVRIPCFPNVDSVSELPSGWVTGENNNPLQMSPMDFYVEEQVVSLLNYWLLSGPIHSYGQAIDKVPTETMAMIDDWSGIERSGAHSFRILNDLDIVPLQKSLRKNNAKASLEVVSLHMAAIRQLSHCPACNTPASFEPRDKQTFIARCRENSCEMEWTIQYTNSEKQYRQYVRDDSKNSFSASGRWLEKVVISGVH